VNTGLDIFRAGRRGVRTIHAAENRERSRQDRPGPQESRLAERGHTWPHADAVPDFGSSGWVHSVDLTAFPLAEALAITPDSERCGVRVAKERVVRKAKDPTDSRVQAIALLNIPGYELGEPTFRIRRSPGGIRTQILRLCATRDRARRKLLNCREAGRSARRRPRAQCR
jgi:hypothetical protein